MNNMKWLLFFILILAFSGSYAQNYSSNLEDDVYGPSVSPQQIQYESALRKGGRQNGLGTGLLIGGGCLFATGAALFAVDRYSASKNPPSKEDPSADVSMALVYGITAMIGGAGMIAGGVVFKIIGKKKLRRAKMYEEQLRKEQVRDQAQSVSLQLVPVVNPISRVWGGNLALIF